MQDLCESIKGICGKYGIKTYFRGNKPIKNILVSPEDKDSIQCKSAIIDWYRCDRANCNEEYIRESAITSEEKCKEHLRALCLWLPYHKWPVNHHG